MDDYKEYIKRKEILFSPIGFEPTEINPILFPFQKDITKWAVRKGRACLFEDCGLGKTFQQLEWLKQITQKEKEPGLIVAPLAVSEQTKNEGKKLNINVNICQNKSDIKKGINITNYEKLHKFNGNDFRGVVLDESSILKNMSGTIRNQIINMFNNTPYKLACTATPSPNDYMELGNHAEFLGIMTYSEMLSMFFINDSGNTGKWRLKKHANEDKFWKWLCSWAVMLTKPSDLGYEQDGFDLSNLHYFEHMLKSDYTNSKGFFTLEANTLDERRKIRKETITLRCEKAAKIVNKINEQCLIWCGLNDESALLSKLIKDSKEINGSTDYDLRKKWMLEFANKKIKRLITKPSIAGFGMNWQNCNNAIFVGLNDSWEQFYQAVRRIYRFGQKKDVNIHIILEEREGSILKNIQRKDSQANYMVKSMLKHTKEITKQEIKSKKICKEQELKKILIPNWI